MKHPLALRLTSLSLLALGGTALSSAAPITYTITAIASGFFDGSAYANQTITLTGTGDTTGITNPGGVYDNPVSATVSVSGLGTDTFTDTLHVFDLQSGSNSAAGISNGIDILDTRDAAFATYDLSTSIGPITGGSLFNSGASFNTTRGTFRIEQVGSSTFTATTSPVPEPASLSVLGVGALALLRRRRKA